MHQPPDHARRGATLMEVVVALALAGLVLLSARRMLQQLGDAGIQLTRETIRADRERNAERELAGLLARLEVGTDSTARFAGEIQAMRLTTWCDAPAGWQERCTVDIAFDSVDASLALVVDGAGSERLVIRRDVAGGFRYITKYDDPSTWFVRWGDGNTAPVGVALIVDRDTTIFRIGERG